MTHLVLILQILDSESPKKKSEVFRKVNRSLWRSGYLVSFVCPRTLSDLQPSLFPAPLAPSGLQNRLTYSIIFVHIQIQTLASLKASSNGLFWGVLSRVRRPRRTSATCSIAFHSGNARRNSCFPANSFARCIQTSSHSDLSMIWHQCTDLYVVQLDLEGVEIAEANPCNFLIWMHHELLPNRTHPQRSAARGSCQRQFVSSLACSVGR